MYIGVNDLCILQSVYIYIHKSMVTIYISVSFPFIFTFQIALVAVSTLYFHFISCRCDPCSILLVIYVHKCCQVACSITNIVRHLAIFYKVVSIMQMIATMAAKQP